MDNTGHIIFFIEMNKSAPNEETIIHQDPDIPADKIIIFQAIIDDVLHRPGGYGALDAKKNFDKNSSKLGEKKDDESKRLDV